MGYIESLMAENEHVVVRTRQHWMVLASSLVGNFLAALIFLVLVGMAVAIAPHFALLAVLLSLLMILPVLNFVRVFLNWWNEEYLVTNRRVIQAEGIINKHVIDSSLEKVNDVVLNQSVLGRLMNYGDIEILTASEMGVNRLDKIARPVQFKTEMLNQKESLGLDEHLGRRARHDDIPALIAELGELRNRGVLSEAEFQQKKAELLSKM